MGRFKQIFIAPDKDEDVYTPIEWIGWRFGREAVIHKEHWEIIIEFAQEKMPEFGELLEEVSYLDGDFSNWTDTKTLKLHEGLKKLQMMISNSEPLNAELTDEIKETYTNEQYNQMIEAVINVIEESQQMGEMFDAYTDS